MRLIFFFPHNRLFKRDGDEFQARALDCAKLWTLQGHRVKSFELPKAKDPVKRQFVKTVLQSICTNSVDRIAFFCHGTANWFDSGYTTATAFDLSSELTRVTIANQSRIALYCCLTGKGLDGVADALSRAADCLVLAHKTSGHTTRNPYKRRFENGQMLDMWPKDKAAMKEWIQRLKTPYGPFEVLED
jgi:folylpolyglutamate synthase/dihydropteroate synthase